MAYALIARKAALSGASSTADHVNQPQTEVQHAGDGSTVNDADGSPSNTANQDDGIHIPQAESIDDALAPAQASDPNTIDALPPMMVDESDPIPDAPILFGVRTVMNLLSNYPEDTGVDVEPSPSANRDIPIAAENHAAERVHRYDPLAEFRDQAGAHTVSTQVNAELQSSAPQPKKRRRRGPRLTRVKNERAKKAQAKAKAMAKSKEVNTPLEGTESSAGPTRRTTRAMTRTAEHTEESNTVESARKSKGKGKAISKDLPSGDATATGSKRKRYAGDNGDEGAPQEDSGEAGPSRPTRRTRQKLQAPVDEEAPQPPPTRRTRAITRATALEAPEPARGLKRYRSLAPEPSQGRIDAERKRARLASPERLDDSPVATSSRVTLDHSNTSVKIEEASREVPRNDPMDDNIAVEEPMQVQSDLVIAERESADAGSEPPNHPPAHPSDEDEVYGPSETPSPPPQAFPFREDAFRFRDSPERPPRINVPEHDPRPSLHIPPSPVPPPGMFPPLPPGNRLRRHATKIIGGKVYRPEDPYYYRR